MMTGCIVTRTAFHIKQTSIPTKQYLCDEIMKAEKWHQGDDNLYRLVNAYYPNLHK